MVKHKRQLITSGHLETLILLLQIAYFNQIFEEKTNVGCFVFGFGYPIVDLQILLIGTCSLVSEGDFI